MRVRQVPRRRQPLPRSPPCMPFESNVSFVSSRLGPRAYERALIMRLSRCDPAWTAPEDSSARAPHTGQCDRAAGQRRTSDWADVQVRYLAGRASSSHLRRVAVDTGLTATQFSAGDRVMADEAPVLPAVIARRGGVGGRRDGAGGRSRSPATVTGARCPTAPTRTTPQRRPSGQPNTRSCWTRCSAADSPHAADAGDAGRSSTVRLAGPCANFGGRV